MQIINENNINAGFNEVGITRIYDFVKLMDLRRGLVIFVGIQLVARPACGRQGRGTRGKGEG
jgi:hypothetical protein